MDRLFVPVIHGASLDRPDEVDTLATAHCVAGSLRRLGYNTDVVALTPDLAGLAQLATRRPRLVFNLVEALAGKGTGAIAALDHLARLRLPYTGVSAEAYAASNSKIKTKHCLIRHAIPTPAFWHGSEAIPSGVTVIVKSVDEHGSLGMDQGSIVDGAEATAEIRRRETEFGDSFFAEAFVDGREFNVSLMETRSGPVVLPPAEIDFTALPAGHHAIVDFAAKWNPDDIAYQATPRVFVSEETEPVLAAGLRSLSLSCWRAFSMTGYARVDFRVDAAGRPFVLEVNANPCLAPDAGFAAAAARAGYDYDGMIGAIVDVAESRLDKAA